MGAVHGEAGIDRNGEELGSEIGVDQALSIVAEHSCIVLDVRSAEEFRLARIAGSTNVPIEELASRYVDTLQAGRRVICVCRAGERSLRAAEALRRAGYHVEALRGGLKAWEEAGGPLEPARASVP
jgi:rhodanese-related sulfurtransferase